MQVVAQFLRELKRRRVVKTAALYVIGSWVLLQVADLAFPAFGIPDTALRYVFGAAVAGFPLALIFGWRFDIQDGKIRRTTAATQSELASEEYQLNTFDTALLALLGLVTVVIVYQASSKILGIEATTPIVQDSTGLFPNRTLVAVLPFENLGDPADEFLAHGITDQINGRLSSLDSLAVISNSSGRLYDGTDKTPIEIGSELGVEYLITGTIRWANVTGEPPRVRISPRLIRTNDAYQTWSQTYEKTLIDVFSAEVEIANAVVQEIGATLFSDGSIDDTPTENLQAYEAYLQSFKKWDVNCPSSPDQIKALNKAVNLDPDFAQAWARLADVYSTRYAHCFDKSPETYEKLQFALNRATELAPDSNYVLYVQTRTRMQIARDYQGSLELLDAAGSRIEQQANLLNIRGRVLRRLGRWDEAILDFRKTFVLDPRSWWIPMQIASAHMYRRDYDLALEYFDRAVALEPVAAVNRMRQVRIYWLQSANLEQARAILENTPSELHRSPRMVWSWFWQNIYEENFDGALEALERFEGNWISAAEGHWPVSLYLGEAHTLLGSPDEGKKYYETAELEIQERIAQTPNESELLRALARTYSGLGKHSEAIQAARQAQAIYPLEQQPYFGSTDAIALALALTKGGQLEEALQLMDTLLSMPALISIPMLELDPTWNSLTQAPGFKTLKKKHTEQSLLAEN